MQDLFVLLASAALCVTQDSEKHQAPLPLNSGTTWVYSGKWFGRESEETWKIAGTEKRKGVDCAVLEMERPVPSGPDGEVHLEKSTLYLRSTETGVEIVDALMKRISEEERYFILLPLKAGTKGSIYWSAPGEATVREKQEEIEVPAGKFTCWVLEWESSYPDTKAASRVWISPGTGVVRRETTWTRKGAEPSTDLLELRKHTPGEQ